MASCYGNESAGNLTASGAVFNPGAYTAAHKTFPFGTKVQFCYQGCIVGTINDRGPLVGDREYDLSKATAVAIGVTPAGTGDVTATVLWSRQGDCTSGNGALRSPFSLLTAMPGYCESWSLLVLHYLHHQ